MSRSGPSDGDSAAVPSGRAAASASHDHDDHAGHDYHDHDDHSGHDHAGHDHHDHDDHSGHDHAGHDHHDHDDHSGHDHHDHAHDLREASRRTLIISLGIILFFMVVEIVGGILSGSLALLADAGHMATDAGAIALALIAMWVANRPSSVDRTFGFARTEILAAFVNILTLWLISGWVIWEAVHRIGGEPEVEGVLMTAVGVVGLIVNIIVAYILHGSSEHSLNVQGAFLHVLGDLLGSIAVIVSGALVMGFGWNLADPIVSIIIGVFILFLSYRPAMQIFHVLIEGVPPHIDLYALCHEIEEIEGVTVIHDVHAWTITSGYDSISAHIMVDHEHPNRQSILDEAVVIARHRYNLSHITFQVETSVEGCTEDHHVGHLEATSRAR